MISIITPTYNRAHLLGRMIKSVRQQTFEQWELLIIDDGSTDETREVVGRIKDPRINYTYTTHSGAATKRNLGLDLAQNDYIIFLDSDDEVERDWLNLMWKGVQDNNAEIVCCAHKRFDAEGNLIQTIYPENVGNMFNGYNVILSYISGTFLIKKKILSVVGGYNPNLPSGQHTDLLIRLLPFLKSHSVYNIYTPLVLIHEHSGFRIRGDFEARYKGGIEMLSIHKSIFEENEQIFFNFLSSVGVSAIRANRVREGKKLLRKAYKLNPLGIKSFARMVIAHIPYINKRFWKI